MVKYIISYIINLLTIGEFVFLSKNLKEKHDLYGATEFWRCRAAWGVKDEYI